MPVINGMWVSIYDGKIELPWNAVKDDKQPNGFRKMTPEEERAFIQANCDRANAANRLRKYQGGTNWGQK